MGLSVYNGMWKFTESSLKGNFSGKKGTFVETKVDRFFITEIIQVRSYNINSLYKYIVSIQKLM